MSACEVCVFGEERVFLYGRELTTLGGRLFFDSHPLLLLKCFFLSLLHLSFKAFKSSFVINLYLLVVSRISLIILYETSLN